MDNKECFEDLANAIIVMAIRDYRVAKKVLKRHPKNDTAKKMVKEVEQFLLSAWYAQLTKVDGARLLKSLQQDG